MPIGFCCKISGEGVVESCITGGLGLGKHVDAPVQRIITTTSRCPSRKEIDSPS